MMYMHWKWEHMDIKLTIWFRIKRCVAPVGTTHSLKLAMLNEIMTVMLFAEKLLKHCCSNRRCRYWTFMCYHIWPPSNVCATRLADSIKAEIYDLFKRKVKTWRVTCRGNFVKGFLFTLIRLNVLQKFFESWHVATVATSAIIIATV